MPPRYPTSLAGTNRGPRSRTSPNRMGSFTRTSAAASASVIMERLAPFHAQAGLQAPGMPGGRPGAAARAALLQSLAQRQYGILAIRTASKPKQAQRAVLRARSACSQRGDRPADNRGKETGRATQGRERPGGNSGHRMPLFCCVRLGQPQPQNAGRTSA
jgi:hypothetical protein